MNKLWKPALFFAAIAVMAIGVLGSGAWFTDTASGAGAELYSGTLSIDENKLSIAELGTISNMAPGDVTDEAVIVIKNDGTIPLAWFGDLVINNSYLKDAIYIEYAQMEFLAPDNSEWEPTDNFITDGDGSGPYPTAYEAMADASSFGVVTLDQFDGHNGMGSAPYEFLGALNPGYRYKLTLRFGFAEDAGNDYQGRGPLNLSFRVEATQVTEDALLALHSNGDNLHGWLSDQLVKQQ